MPIIKKYDLNKVEDVQKTYDLMCEMQEKHKYDLYDENSIMLVRTTSIFPKNRELKTLKESTFIAKSGMNFIHSAYYYELDRNTLNQLETYEVYYRSTIHFTENGLVLSHMYGNFENQSFIILEPLKEQLGKSDFRNFAGQDTFVKGSVTLSDKAILIIKSGAYESLKEQYPELETFNVILYDGIKKETKEKYIEDNPDKLADFDVNDERAIVELVLMDLGIVPELIGTHYIVQSPTSEKIEKLNIKLGEKYNVLSNGKHNYSEEYKKDFENNLIITNIFNKLLLDFIVRKHNLNINEYLDNNEITNNTAFRLVDLLGLEEISLTINDFNETIEKMKEDNLLVTSEEILNNNIPNIYDAYTQYNEKKQSK